MTKSLLIEQMERAELLRREIAATEHRIGLRTIVSPCDGFITEILVHLGDAVDAFVPIFTIEELKPSYLDVFIPEQSSLQLEPGMKVEIYSSRNHKYNTTGTITFVHPGFTQASERLSFRGQIFWARKVRVELPQDHHLLPGEVVNIRVQANDRHKKSAAIASENMANPHNSKHPLLANMQIPKILMEKTRFEPSGVAWLPDINKYLIVSDDTGIHDSQNDHAAWLFLMDAAGRVDSSPVPLIGITTVNDLEAIAPAGDETFYLVSSQNISKKNRRPGNRELIIKVKREGEKFVVTCQVQFLSLLLDSYSWPELKALGLTQFDKDGKPILNIEGATFYDEALYLGLKEPVSDTGAIIWKLTEVDRIFDGYTLRSNQLSVYGYAKLGQHKNTTTGISDLMFDQNGRMWALSTIVDAGNNDQLGGFFRIDRFADGRLEATCLYSFPGLKPEGICQPNPERFLIIFDKDNDNPEFCYFDVEKL